MKSRLRLRLELLGLSWRRSRTMTAGAIAAITADVVAVAVVAISLRTAVDSSAQGDREVALAAAVGAALAYAMSAVLRDMTANLVGTVADRVGRLDLHPRIHADIAGIDGLDHLERPEYLDRVTVVRGGAGALMRWLWNSITTIAGVAKLGVTVMLLGAISPWLLALLPLAAVPIWTNKQGQRVVAAAEVRTAERHRLQQHLFDLLVNAGSGKEVRVSGNGREIAVKQTEAWDAVVRDRSRSRAVAAAWNLSGWLVFALGFAGALALVAYRTAQGEGTLGDLVLMVTIVSNLRQAMQSVVVSATETAGASRVIDPYLWLQDYLATDRLRTHGSTPVRDTVEDGIALDSVTYTYPGADRPALSRVSARLGAGTVTAIVGEYGSGKTTLVKMLCKFHSPDSGHVTVDGTDLAELDTSSWRERVTAAFQDFGRFHIPFADTVGIGDLPHRQDLGRIAEAVHAADAHSLVERLPEGYETQLGRQLGGVDLSEGQWQRTALARASMRPQPLLFVLDEPTASLDAPSEHDVFRRYMARARELADRNGAVTVVVSHRFSSVADADRILVMHQGEVVESGTHDDLMSQQGRYARLYSIQADAYTKKEGGHRGKLRTRYRLSTDS